jgi:hypothetical protein
MGDMRNAYRVLVETPEGKETTWMFPGVDGRIIIK